MHLLYWGPWQGSAPYLWAERGDILDPADVLPSELQELLRTRLVYPLRLQEGVSHIADWTILAFPDGSAFLASYRLDQGTMAELSAKHFPAPWRRLTRRMA